MKQYRMPVGRLFGQENQRHAPTLAPDTETVQLERRVAGVADRAGSADAAAQPVRVIELPRPRDPQLRYSRAIDISVAAPNNSVILPIRGNCILYADSTNGTDRLSVQYQDTGGDNSQPARVMVPGRLRRERYFNQIVISWTATAGAVATIEVYDDPDGALYIQD